MESVTFIAITIYITLTTVFFAAVVAAAPAERMETIRRGYVFAGLLAAILGILGYFDVAGLGPYFTLYDNTRAMGPFKDPNVFGPFLVPPMVWLSQDLLLRRGRLLVAAAKLSVLLLALLLSFSRGAIIDFVASAAILLALTFLTATSPRDRARTVAIAAAGALLVVVVVAIALVDPRHSRHGARARLVEPKTTTAARRAASAISCARSRCCWSCRSASVRCASATSSRRTRTKCS